MSRSYKKHPFCGIASTSDKWYKRMRHGAERSRLRAKLAHWDFDGLEFELAPYDDWASPKDGKIRFDPTKYPELMRK